ncbi:NUDIX domain-containing protein [Ferdinandcohnia quinoae]|uniref:NUDIX hydrolase n=1 Tax=Fredinandcohnia quinoae TaxID=2918902 RepID=A0AAW5E6C3_9BACI|nr:NUDIX hydrolase [Fredinandcohnia sp. SECRCQ15]MCH1626434.1 NUDIX hydrolase [Fredinandcohnia sp. SECRCQ15]
MIRKAVGAIVFQNDRFLIVYKGKINTLNGKEMISGEWDFIKGGVEVSDQSEEHSLFRELKEETGSTHYKVIKQFDEKIVFEFPAEIKSKIGYESQETTMFLVEYFGEIDGLNPLDSEISELQFLNKEEIYRQLTHLETKEFFKKHLS